MTDQEIEQVVRAVLAEVRARTASTSQGTTGKASATQDNTCKASATQDNTGKASATQGSAGEAKGRVALAPPVSGPTAGELVVDARVVTLAAITGRLGEVKRVVVPSRAVVTPTVHDELRRRNIALVHASPVAAKTAETVRLVLVNMGKRFDATALARALSEDGMPLDFHRLDCLNAATDLLASELLKPRTLGALVTRHTPVALCLANRHPGVRAVAGRDLRQSIAACEAVGANLLVVNPYHSVLFQLRQMLSEFCRGGVRVCPEAFRQRLG